MLRILFINRMASMERGGGETFDLEISRHLAQMGHQVTFLTGIPVLGRARLPIECRVSGVGCWGGESRTLNPEPAPPLTINHQPSTISSVHLRAPMFPWFPWDRVKAGWRVRVAEFWLFEKLAARWAWKRRDQFDIIQVCELPTFVSSFKSKIDNRKSEMDTRAGCRVSEKGSEVSHSAIGNRQSALPRVVMRLTAPNVYDPSGGIQKADALIASGTSIAKLRETVRPDCQDIPNAVDTERFKPQVTDFRERHGIGSCDPILLYVARFQAFKNHDLLVRAFAHVLREEPRARLVLAGGGPLWGDIKRRVTSLGSALCNNSPRPSDTPPEEGRKREGSVPSLEGNEGWVASLRKQVLFLGEVSFDELPAVYAATDIKVISSEYESFCFAAVEAMASGLPVVTTDCGWVPGLIGDSLPPIKKQWVDHDPEPPGRFDADVDGERIRETPGGLIVGRTEPGSMAKSILILLRDEAKRCQMGAWNREKAVREHGWEASARKLEAVYRDLCR